MKGALWCLLLLALAAALPARAADAAFDARIDALLHLSDDRPDAALSGLQVLVAPPGDAAASRRLLMARGIVLARSGREVDARGRADALQALARRNGDAQAEAARQLVLALVDFDGGRVELAAGRAQTVLDALRPYCDPQSATLVAGGCEHRAAWQALQVLQQQAVLAGDWPRARTQAQQAHALTAAAADGARRAWSSADLAWLAARVDGTDAAQPLLQQAQRLVAHAAVPVLLARVALAEARMAQQLGDLPAQRRAAEHALRRAREAASPRSQAEAAALLADALRRQGLAAESLRHVEQTLPTVARHGDWQGRAALFAQSGLAKIALRRSADGLQDLARAEALMQDPALGDARAGLLRTYDEALAAIGEARAALQLFHRERALDAELARGERDRVLQQLRQQGDRERQRRDIELQSRDNQLKAAALSARELTQRAAAVAALLLLLSAALMVRLYRRVRATQQRLVANQASLRQLSERDPLTQLANRRHLQTVMSGKGGGRALPFEGALLLVDIDHFKHVNDGHGHAVGDVVLCEVARRLNETVRGDDLVVRWGGEEFLVLALQVPAEHAEALAERVLRHIGERPVWVQGEPVRVTVSIGYARFPLPPATLPVAWEQAINLADMALYTAKNQGRNRAVGIVAASAASTPELRGIESDFDRAWHEGRVTLKVAPGPPVPA